MTNHQITSSRSDDDELFLNELSSRSRPWYQISRIIRSRPPDLSWAGLGWAESTSPSWAARATELSSAWERIWRKKLTTVKEFEFLMALRDDFEPARASLLHWHPLPTLRAALSKLISEETRLHTHRPKSTDGVLASAQPKPQYNWNRTEKPKKQCKYCNFFGYTVEQCHKRIRALQRDGFKPVAVVQPNSILGLVVHAEPSTSSISTSDLEVLIDQIISRRESSSTSVMSVTPEYTDSAFLAILHEDGTIPQRSCQGPSNSTDDMPLAPFESAPQLAPQPVDPPTRRSTRVRLPSPHLNNYYCYPPLAVLHEPQSFREASTDPLWQQAMNEELHALSKIRTWDLVYLPPGKSLVGCKCVYKIKTKFDGLVERYKARLVACGFTQEYGIDYEETFPPVARITSVRSLLAVAAVRKWDLFQMDVKNAFLNGDLSEDVYMKPPPGYDHPTNKVCRLRKALYALKQAPRAWYGKFHSTLGQLGFTTSSYDSALFIKKSSAGIILLLLYVDDMIITGDNIYGIQKIKEFLSTKFEMKDLGMVSYFLGLEVSKSSTGYYLSQTKYASDLISRAGITDAKTAHTSLETNVKLRPTDGQLLKDPTRYRQLVGSLIYLTVTRLDISYVVHLSVVSRSSSESEFRALADTTAELRSCNFELDKWIKNISKNTSFGWVNVKDVANAHILAFEVPSPSGRYCLVETVVHYSEIAKILHELYPSAPFPHKSAGDKPFTPTFHVSKEKTKSLGIEFIPLKVSLKETVDSLKEKNFAKF
ncbi:Retrovirus-related Pol polyprotein from transposon RE1-like protein [Drosera capensis]